MFLNNFFSYLLRSVHIFITLYFCIYNSGAMFLLTVWVLIFFSWLLIPLFYMVPLYELSSAMYYTNLIYLIVCNYLLLSLIFPSAWHVSLIFFPFQKQLHTYFFRLHFFLFFYSLFYKAWITSFSMFLLSSLRLSLLHYLRKLPFPLLPLQILSFSPLS